MTGADVRVVVDRDSVHAGDDTRSHEFDRYFPAEVTIGEVVRGLAYPGFVPTRDTWAVYQVLGADHPHHGFPPRSEAITTLPVAILARRTGTPRYQVDGRSPLSLLAGGADPIMLFCRTCGNQDPDEAFAVAAAGGETGRLLGELHAVMATLHWAVYEGTGQPADPLRRDGARAGRLAEHIRAMFGEQAPERTVFRRVRARLGGAAPSAGAAFLAYLRSDPDALAPMPVYPDNPVRQEELDAVLRDLASWTRSDLGELFVLAYEAHRVLNVHGLYQAAFALGDRAMAALRGDGRARRDLRDHLDRDLGPLRRGGAGREVSSILTELATVAAR